MREKLLNAPPTIPFPLHLILVPLLLPPDRNVFKLVALCALGGLSSGHSISGGCLDGTVGWRKQRGGGGGVGRRTNIRSATGYLLSSAGPVRSQSKKPFKMPHRHFIYQAVGFLVLLLRLVAKEQEHGEASLHGCHFSGCGIRRMRTGSETASENVTNIFPVRSGEVDLSRVVIRKATGKESEEKFDTREGNLPEISSAFPATVHIALYKYCVFQ
ncbi:hypothetical protein GWI33_016906 [Rhynchophorus ferrugineus]|uniref:Uncharacterized protein n=1 Tax=Rhynchophorus ferrugineus TaxID=354439 RepID=A0A834M6P9_RHYFE|nr:hypothetical protein GWI33_016906 [Rhynchophorus ferrugineus]